MCESVGGGSGVRVPRSTVFVLLFNLLRVFIVEWFGVSSLIDWFG